MKSTFFTEIRQRKCFFSCPFGVIVNYIGKIWVVFDFNGRLNRMTLKKCDILLTIYQYGGVVITTYCFAHLLNRNG